MDLSDLRYFEAVAQSGSLSAAARRLHLAQPSLTLAMKRLEDQLGTTLFLRGPKGVALTESGQQLREAAKELFALVERTEQRIRGTEDDEAGKFVIGCHESLGAYFLPRFMSRFVKQSPRIELSLWNASSAAVTDAVVTREVHFGLIVNPRPHPDLVLVKLFSDAMDVFVASGEEGADEAPKSRRGRGSKDSGGDFQAASERLRSSRLIYAGRVGQCQELIERLAAVGLLPTSLLACGDLELVKSLALSGLGVALLPRRVAAYGQPGKLRRLHPKLPFIPDTIFLAFRADAHLTRASRILKDALIEEGKNIDRPETQPGTADRALR